MNREINQTYASKLGPLTTIASPYGPNQAGSRQNGNSIFVHSALKYVIFVSSFVKHQYTLIAVDVTGFLLDNHNFKL